MSTPSEPESWVPVVSGAASTGEPVAAGGVGGQASALGSDPFADQADFDPFVDGLAALGATEALPIPEPEPESEPGDWLDRFLNAEDRRRLDYLDRLLEGEVGYDRFGLAPGVVRRMFPFFAALYRHYFRVQSQGHEHLPRRGSAIVAANRAGLLPFDAAMLSIDTLLHTDPPRLLRNVLDRWTGTVPWLNVLSARVGNVVGTPENLTDLLSENQLLLMFPEGMEGALKPISQRYQLQRFGVGFAELALRAQVPIVPAAVVGSDDQSPILFDFKTMARSFGLPSLPITPTFPWLGPVGLVPYPVRYRIIYGEPIRVSERFGADSANDPGLVRELSREVRRAVQQLVDRNR